MAPNENQIICLILLCSCNITILQCLRLEGMFPMLDSSLLLLMSSSLDFPICKKTPECSARFVKAGSLSNCKTSNYRKDNSLQPREEGGLGKSESQPDDEGESRASVALLAAAGAVLDVNPNAEAKTKAGSTLILWLLLHWDADGVTLQWVTGSLTLRGFISRGHLCCLNCNYGLRTKSRPAVSFCESSSVALITQIHCRWCSELGNCYEWYHWWQKIRVFVWGLKQVRDGLSREIK